MTLQVLPYDLTVCKIASPADLKADAAFYFFGKTDEEMSLVCITGDVPESALDRSDGWKGFRVQGVLDFSLIGILAQLTGALAKQGIGLFAVSTFNTDYILVRADQLDRALRALETAGYTVE